MEQIHADLEIRIFAQEEQGFPVTITHEFTTVFEGGYLDPDCLSFVPSDDPAADGERLFKWLLSDPDVMSAWDRARGRTSLRRIRLRIDDRAPELHTLPWELLREPGPRWQNPYLAACTATPFSRYLATPHPQHKPLDEETLRVLVAIAAPVGLERFNLAPIDVEQEWEVMRQVTEQVVDIPVKVDRLPQPCTMANLQAALNRGYHILHFVGHGSFHKERGAALFLADEQNQVMIVGEEELSTSFAHLITDAGGSQPLRMVYFSSCATATRSPSDAFRGLAPKLLQAGLSSVIAMQEPISMETARVFANAFYGGLFRHGVVDRATNEARRAVLTRDLRGAHIPVLFMRLRDGILFADRTSAVKEYKPALPEGDNRNLHDHRILRQKVQRNWIQGLLHRSLYKEVLIQLSLQERPAAVDNPLSQVWVHHSTQPDVTLAACGNITDVYEQMGHKLLILGEPGSGKTTVLLELARELLAQTAIEERCPTPVVFRLSSWAERRADLADWLVDELDTLYKIDKEQGKLWLERRELVLLLDGLDEVAQEHREACIEAINEFEREYQLPLVVCCRQAEYESLSVKIGLEGAVQLHALSPNDIAEYLSRIGQEVSGLSVALQGDHELQKLASSPLMLSIMVLAYRGWSAEAILLPREGQSRYQHLFDIYIRQMFQRSGDKHPYAPHKTLGWLQWLAGRVLEHREPIFLIERMQPSWLTKPQLQHIFPLLLAAWGPAYGAVAGAGLGVIFGLIYVVLNSMMGANVTQRGLDVSLANSMMVGLVAGAFLGMVAGIVDGLYGGLRTIRTVNETSQAWVIVRRSLYVGFFWGVLLGFAFYLFDPLGEEPVNAFMLGLIGLLVGSLIAGFMHVKPAVLSGISAAISSITQGTTPSRVMLERLRFGLTFGLLVGISFSLLIGIVVGLLVGAELGAMRISTTLWTTVARLRLIAVPVGMLGGIIFGLLFEPGTQADLSEVAETQTPNQGIRLAAQNALSLGLSFGLFGFAIGLLSGWQFRELYIGLIFGLYIGLVGGLIAGADSVIKHYTLRFVLYESDLVPFQYAQFLDACVEMNLLYRIGGGYDFIHRLLMEHVASLNEARIAAISARVMPTQGSQEDVTEQPLQGATA